MDVPTGVTYNNTEVFFNNATFDQCLAMTGAGGAGKGGAEMRRFRVQRP